MPVHSVWLAVESLFRRHGLMLHETPRGQGNIDCAFAILRLGDPLNSHHPNARLVSNRCRRELGRRGNPTVGAKHCGIIKLFFWLISNQNRANPRAEALHVRKVYKEHSKRLGIAGER